MINTFINFIVKFIKQKAARLILESTLILPMFFALIIIIIYLMLTAAQLNTQLFVQLTTVERLAFIWDEYDRDFASGVRTSNRRYDVYENDQMLYMISGLFSLLSEKNPNQLVISSGNDTSSFGRKLRQDKLLLANEYVSALPGHFTGVLSFEPRFFSRTAIELDFKSLISRNSTRLYSTAAITDATQHIRGVDLLLYYTEKLKDMTNKEQWLAKGKKAIPTD